jgi:magnesium transporter
MKSHGGIFFSNFLETIYSNLEDEIENTADEIKTIETDIFSSDERVTIESIAKTSKRVFDIRSKLRTHKEVLDVFSTDSNKIFGFEFVPYPERVKSKYNELMNNLDNQKENLMELKDTTDFLLTNKTNQIVKFFTVVSFILLPMTFLASFFGMNTKFPVELVSSQFGTAYIMILMLSISVLVLTYLHYKKMI